MAFSSTDENALRGPRTNFHVCSGVADDFLRVTSFGAQLLVPPNGSLTFWPLAIL
jgi:hypothetical protein